MQHIKTVIDRKKKKLLPGEPVWEKHFTCDDYYGLQIRLSKDMMHVGDTTFFDLSPAYMEEYLKKQQAMMETVRYALSMHKKFFQE